MKDNRQPELHQRLKLQRHRTHQKVKQDTRQQQKSSRKNGEVPKKQELHKQQREQARQQMLEKGDR